MALFLVKGFDINTVNQRYSNGDFNNLSLEDIFNIKTETNTKVNINEHTFMTIDNRGIRTAIVTTNTGICNKCLWCRKSMENVSRIIGVPVSATYKGGYLNMQVSGGCCCFECAYALLKSRDTRHVNHNQIVKYLIQAFYTLHPNKTLREAPDWILHEANGGPLSDKQFHDNHHEYYDTGRVKLVPVSNMYGVRERH